MNIYLRRYFQLVRHYKNNPPPNDIYTEKHHIRPRCLGGSDAMSNMVTLPAKAHYLAHLLLSKACPSRRKLLYAYAAMSLNTHLNARQYARINEAKAKLASEDMTTERKERLTRARLDSGQYDKPGTMTGKKHNESSKKKMSISAKIRNMTPEAEAARNQKISKSKKGIMPSKKQLANLLDNTGKKLSAETIRRRTESRRIKRLARLA
jgi:hypothetical protein